MSMQQTQALNSAPTEKKANRWRIFYRVPQWIYVLILFSLAWELYARFSDNVSRLPTFSKVIVALWGLIMDGSLLSALFISLQGLLVGFLLAIVVGVLLGLLMGYRPLLDRALMIYMDILTAIPMVSIIPLVVVFFGLGLFSRVVVVFLYSVVIVVVNTKTGVHDTDPRLVEMSNSFGATKWQIATKIFLPSAIPFIVAGIRLALGRAIIGMVTAEMILSSVGIGNLLMRVTSSFRSDQVFAIILSLLIISVLLITVVQKLEKRFLRN
jgi:ABC-type nitrate/sulfonate/bicarbonate transport system permease component